MFLSQMETLFGGNGETESHAATFLVDVAGGNRSDADVDDPTPDDVNASSLNNDTETLHEGPEGIIVPILFGLIFLIGIVGNGTLIFTVLVNKNMRNTPNVLIVSLALGDLLLLLISVPFISTIYTFVEWPYGEAMCKFTEFTISLSLGVSVLTLTALSGKWCEPSED